VTALVVAPHGGVIKHGRTSVTADRTLLTARSIEFDAVVIAAGVAPETGNDLKLVLLLQEAYRHCKAFATWGDGTVVLEGAHIPLDDPGVSQAESVSTAFTNALVAALGLHRAWDRAELVMSSAVPPAV
jgi:catalase